MSFQTLSKAACFCVFLLVAQISFAQDRVVTGRITDQRDGSGIQGVTVSAKGTRIATQTAADGSFRISIPSSVTTLVFSSVGFATQEMAIGESSTVDVAMVVTSASMGEVVVVAYGTRRKVDLTGAVTSISAKDFQKGNIVSS